jgi:hypothetical protein
MLRRPSLQKKQSPSPRSALPKTRRDRRPANANARTGKTIEIIVVSLLQFRF